jgi:signal transduction histidine kinase/CheY-like chemotaxis protein
LLELKDIGFISNAKEIMALFPTVDSVLPSFRSSLLQQLMTEIENNFKKTVNNDNDESRLPQIRLLIPFDEVINEIIQKSEYGKNILINYVNEIKNYSIDDAVLLILDKKISLILKAKEPNDNGNIINSNDDDKNHEDLSNSHLIFLYNKFDNAESKSIVLSHIAAFEHIWDQAETNKLIEINDRLKGDFINICAHELRSPIQPILGLSILVRNRISDTTQREILDVIIRNAKRLKRLADDLLEVTKIESNLIKLNKEKFNLNNFLNDALTEYSNKILKEDFNNYALNIIKCLPKERVFFVDADKDRLIQVIYNILNNAVRASGDAMQNENPESRSIQFSLTQNAFKEIQISIKDRGLGIDEQILSKLFTKFITNSGKGIGLGLFIAKSIIEAHGGKIWAENNEGENGATFHFTLPVLTHSQNNDEMVKILIVDDTLTFALSLKNTFEKNDKYLVDVFNNPMAMLQKFISGYYDFVILDIDMPEINGFDLSHQLRKKDDNLQIIFMTSGGTNYEPLRELYGISEKNHFIKKTLSPEKIFKQLSVVVEKIKSE